MNYDNKKECALCDYWRIYTTGIHKCSLEDRNCPYDKNKKGVWQMSIDEAISHAREKADKNS